MDLAALRPALLSWFSAAAGCPAHWAEAPPAIPLPAPYASLLIAKVLRVGQDELRPEDAPPDEVKVVGHRQLTLRAEVVGLASGALDRLCAAQDALARPTCIELLSTVGAAVLDDAGIDVSFPEDRARMDIRLLVPSEVLDHPGQIEQAGVEITIRRADGTPALIHNLQLGV